MAVVKEMIRCPFCYEPVAAQAMKCKHCLSELPVKKKKTGFVKGNDTFRVGFLVGVLFSLVMGIILYLQFYA